MIQQLDIYGVFIPTLGVWALASFVVFLSASKLFARTGLYRFVWHRPLFDLALYISLLGTLVLLFHRSHWL
ncbi:hypothetical protein A8A54_19195 [Brucella pseudogrignonensis]|uniref:DUF1656 domain-containing protein n=1 Tax=Brucella pseudogrignonensis TaxID=419475 RepID=UPI0007DA7B89|nr:DUF1656 domain-containing protein [Brucella pseudogrignonensis]ANG98734.1 hypothetical protein A8A54_19195 [Brucella pseudogrignonensis]